MIDILFTAAVAPRGLDKGAAIIGGHAAVFTNSESKKWQAKFAAIAEGYAPTSIIECPVRVDILAILPRPKKYMRRSDAAGLIWCPQKPDGDNIRKNVQDAMRSWWRDDKQVVAGQTVKVFAEKTGLPRTIVRVRSLENVCVADIVVPVFGSQVEMAAAVVAQEAAFSLFRGNESDELSWEAK